MKNLNLKNIKNLKIKAFSFITFVVASLIIGGAAWAAKKADCVYFFPENNLVALSAAGESKHNPGIVNYYCCGPKTKTCDYSKDGGKCGCFGNGPFAENAAGKPRDKGGCSYGSNQLACGSNGSAKGGLSNGKFGGFAGFMTLLSKQKPELFKKLSNGKSLEETIKIACNDQNFPAENAEFRKAWASLGPDKDFGALQDAFVSDQYGGSAKSLLKGVGCTTSWNNLPPELQMTMTACTIAAPATFKRVAKKLIAECGADFSRCSKDELVRKTNKYRANLGYCQKSNDANCTHAQNRALEDDKRAETSMRIREALAKNPGKTADQIAQELYGKNICKVGEAAKIDIGTGYVGYSESAGAGASSPSATAGSSSVKSSNNGKTPPKGTKECSISKYRDSFQTCIFCDIFQVLFNTASDIAKKAFRALADGISKLIVLGLAIWLSFNIIKYVSAMEQKEPRTFIKEILNQIFIVLIIYIFLKSDSATFFGLAMEPIFNTGMKLAQMATGTETCTDTFNITTSGGLPASMGINILCTIKSIQGEILDIMALGSTSMCVGFFIESYWGVPIFPHLGYVIVGILLWISALLLMVIYPFLLIDSVLQLSVACALLPAAIGAYAFKITQKYVGKIWETFLNCMFTFVFLSIIIFILTYALKDTVGQTFTDGLENAGIDSDYSIILDKLAWWGTTFLKLIFIMILGWAVLGEAKSFAGTFAGSVGVGGDPIGANVGGLAMSGVKAVGAPVAQGAGKVLDRGRTAIGRTVGEKYNNAKVGFQAWQIKNSSNAKTDADGNVSVTSKSMLGRQITRVLSTDATGKQTISKTKTKGNGNSTTTKTDAFMSVKEKKDSSGNVISRTTEMKAAGAKYLINKDGSTNQVAINALQNNSQHTPNVVNEAILNQMLKERMPGIEGATLNGSFKERNVRSFKDDKGQNVFEVSQINKDGSRNNFRMTMSGNRALTEYEVINKNGSAMSFASDGIVNKKSSYKYNNDGVNGALGTVNAKSMKNKFSFTSHYKELDSRTMDSNGVISNSVPKDEIMFGENDMASFADQIANTGQSEPLNGFK